MKVPAPFVNSMKSLTASFFSREQQVNPLRLFDEAHCAPLSVSLSLFFLVCPVLVPAFAFSCIVVPVFAFLYLRSCLVPMFVCRACRLVRPSHMGLYVRVMSHLCMVMLPLRPTCLRPAERVFHVENLSV